MAGHLFTHRLATRHPHLQFGMMEGATEGGQPVVHSNHRISWLDWKVFWGLQTSDFDDKREFVVRESLGT
jgi:hypothetical protein